MSDGMGREPAYLSSHATNRYFIPNWGNYAIINFKVVLLENGVIRRGHMKNNLNNFYNK